MSFIIEQFFLKVAMNNNRNKYQLFSIYDQQQFGGNKLTLRRSLYVPNAPNFLPDQTPAP
jgi:hypothetical protein